MTIKFLEKSHDNCFAARSDCFGYLTQLLQFSSVLTASKVPTLPVGSVHFGTLHQQQLCNIAVTFGHGLVQRSSAL